MKRYFMLFAAFLMPVIAEAALTPKAGETDNHVRTAAYDPNQLYKINTMHGYITSIQFGKDEKILSVNIGDSSAWLISVQNEIINLKPISENPDTNLNVLTSRGTYQFFLTAPEITSENGVKKLVRKPNENTIFLLRFVYPNDEKRNAEKTIFKAAALSAKNFRYSARGERGVVPISVYDDGRFTYMNFGDNKDIPAIFSVDAKGNESIVNYHLQGNLVVVELLANQFTLRNGTKIATVFNENPQS